MFDILFEKAVNADCMHDCMQNGVQPAGNGLQREQADNKKAPDLQGLTASYFGYQHGKMGDEGFEPPTSTV